MCVAQAHTNGCISRLVHRFHWNCSATDDVL